MTTLNSYNASTSKLESSKIVQYTKMQRRHETGMKRANRKRKGKVNRDLEVRKALRRLSEKQSTSSYYKNFKEYVLQRQKEEHKLYNFYSNKIYRKLKFGVYIKTLQSENKLVKKVRDKFGNNCVIVFGNWNRRKGFRNNAPTPSIGMKRLFREHGFEVYIIDEYKTSSVCRECKGDVENFMRRPNPKPYETYNDKKQEKGKERLVHGLLRCKNESCSKLWNRDILGSQNIQDKGYCILKGEELPTCFQRKSYTGVLNDSGVKPNGHGIT